MEIRKEDQNGIDRVALTYDDFGISKLSLTLFWHCNVSAHWTNTAVASKTIWRPDFYCSL